ncbi:MAG: nodulation protein NfeD [Kiritimatiellia bacterium]|nr:hypothetical protein [Lentisphaerota bacterium]
MFRALIAASLCLMLAGPAAAETVAPTTESAPEVYIIPVEGPIDRALLYVVRRGLDQAERSGAVAVIFTINTPGGRLDAADEIILLLLRASIPTYTLVQSRAFSAGALIAMATDHIYMTPGSVIGDAMPIMISPLGGAQDMPEPMQEKAVSGTAALVRSAAQQKGHDPQLAEAMVRREMEYRIGDEIISPAGQLLTLTDVEAARPVGEDQRPLLSRGTVRDVREMLTELGWPDARTITLEVTTAEKIARMIEAASVLLLAGGLLGLYIEFKTPGFGLPGIAGLICLAIFFWGHHIAGLAGMSEVLIFGLGVLLLMVELLFIPGFGLVGVAGILLIFYAFFSAMAPQLDQITWRSITLADWHTPLLKTTGAVVIGGLAALLLGRRLPGSPLLQRIILSNATGRDKGFRSAPATDDLLNLTGRALTQLRPAGTGMFGDRRLDVVTRGEFVEKDAPLRIVEIHGSRLVVEPIMISDNSAN